MSKSFLIESLGGEILFSLSVGSLDRDLMFESFNKYFLYEDGVVILSTIEGVIYNIKEPKDKTEDNIVELVEIKEDGNLQNKLLSNDVVKSYMKFTSFKNLKKR